jgi:protein-S-isoprenylcysteine O-methyltransferase Ste14
VVNVLSGQPFSGAGGKERTRLTRLAAPHLRGRRPLVSAGVGRLHKVAYKLDARPEKEQDVMNKLIIQALSAFLIGAIALGVLLFLPAWTLNYWQAWVFIVVFMTSVNAIGLYLALKDPALLERRKKFGPTQEQSPAQKIAIAIGVLALLSVFVFSALAHRFGWSPVPAYGSLAGDALVALGLFINLLVFKENTYGGSTIETVADQKVISTGPYALVRHPMYAGALLMITGIPLALDAWWGLAIIAAAAPTLIWRIIDEEKLLKKDLPGYVEYAQRVRYHLVPYLW